MKIQKRFAIPALLFGIALLGGSTAFAASNVGPRQIDMEAFADLSSDKQEAIQKADEIRAAAETEAAAVLDAAGVTQDEMRTAMKAYMGAKRVKLDAALDANDYAAYKALVADGPMADSLTEDVFAKLVQVRALEKSGDTEGAKTLRESLGLKGPGGHGFGGPEGPRPDSAK